MKIVMVDFGNIFWKMYFSFSILAVPASNTFPTYTH